MRKNLTFACLLCAAMLLPAIVRSPHDVQSSVSRPTAGAASATDRTPHEAPHSGEVRAMTIKELGNFSYDPNAANPIPPDVRRLDGSVVRLSGFMIPLDQSDRLTRFALVPSLFSCCYGQPPSLEHIISVECAPGKAVDYTSQCVAVEGNLKVGEIKDNGYVVSLFHLTCTSVSPGR